MTVLDDYQDEPEPPDDEPEPLDEEAGSRDRAIRLFEYLKRLAELRARTVRDLAEYTEVLWFCEVPAEPECRWGFGGLKSEAPTSVAGGPGDRKSTRLNSSHPSISYAVFCLKKK